MLQNAAARIRTRDLLVSSLMSYPLDQAGFMKDATYIEAFKQYVEWQEQQIVRIAVKYKLAYFFFQSYKNHKPGFATF